MSENLSLEKNFVSAVVYIHNEADQIEKFLQCLYGQLNLNFKKFEIICVNDASTDESVEKIEKISGTFEHTNVTLLHMSFYHGLELSMNAGVDLSIGDFVYEFDTVTVDYPEQTIMDVYKQSLAGYDIVSASPDGKQKKSSSLFYKVFESFTFNEYGLHTETFRILSRRVINRISSMNKTVPYRKAIYMNCGLAFTNFVYKKSTNVMLNKQDKKEKKYRRKLAINSLILFTEVGYKFSIWMTFLMMAVTVLVAIYTVVIFAMGISVQGWTTTMLFLSFGFFGLFSILTIIIKYLTILVDLNFKRQIYRIENIQKITN